MEDFLHNSLHLWQRVSSTSAPFIANSSSVAAASRSTEEENAEWEARQQAQLQPWLKDPYFVDDRPNVTVSFMAMNGFSCAACVKH